MDNAQTYVVELAKRLRHDPTITIKNVKEKVSQATGVPVRRLVDKRERGKTAGRPLYLPSLVYFLYSKLGLTYTQIKRITGRTDRSTIAYGVEQMHSLIDEYHRAQQLSDPLAVTEESTAAQPNYIAGIIATLMNDPDLNDNNLEQRLSDEAGMMVEELRSKSRDEFTALMRQACYYLAHKKCGIHPKEIGRRMGRDRSTVIYGIKQVEKIIRIN